jgi:hypothetical protein
MARIIDLVGDWQPPSPKFWRASMPRLSRTAKQHPGLVGVLLAGALLNPVGVAQASDLYEPYGRYGPPRGYYEAPVAPRGPVYGEPRYAPPAAHRRAEVDEAACRVFHRRRVDPYGREVVRRVRVCEEGIVEAPPRWAGRMPRYGYEPQIYEAPRPPRAVGPDWDDDLD